MVRIVFLIVFSLINLKADWLDSNVIQTTNDPGYFKSQTRGLYTLGSSKLKFKNENIIAPVHLEIPRVNIGCGGIDIAFGGFSYLDEKYLVEKLKSISSAAPAFAYQMAISTLCKDCSNIMNELEKMANMVNSINFDTCQATNQAIQWGKTLGEATNKSLMGGQSDDWISNRLKSANTKMEEWKNTISSDYGGDDTKAEEAIKTLTMKGSLLNEILVENDDTKLEDVQLNILGKDNINDYILISSIRAVVGDIIGEEDESGAPRITIIPPSAKENLLIDLIGGTVNETINVASYSKTSKKVIHDVTSFKGIEKRFTDEIKKIVRKLEDKQSIDTESIEFLDGLPIPLYRFLNNMVRLKQTSEQDISLLSEYLAVTQAKGILSYASSMISKSLSSYSSKSYKELSKEDQEKIINLANQLEKLTKDTVFNTSEISKKWDERQKIIKYYKDLEQEAQKELIKQGIYKTSPKQTRSAK